MGFVLALTKRWHQPEQAYREWFTKMPRPQLGEVQLVRVEDDIWVANMIAQKGVRWEDGVPPIRYAALQQCLSILREEALDLGASVHAPRFGAGLAGGKWDVIEKFIDLELTSQGVEVSIYDLA